MNDADVEKVTLHPIPALSITDWLPIYLAFLHLHLHLITTVIGGTLGFHEDFVPDFEDDLLELV